MMGECQTSEEVVQKLAARIAELYDKDAPKFLQMLKEMRTSDDLMRSIILDGAAERLLDLRDSKIHRLVRQLSSQRSCQISGIREALRLILRAIETESHPTSLKDCVAASRQLAAA